MPETTTLCDSRSTPDRRSFGWRTAVFGFFRSRRRHARRTSDPDQLFSDWHHPWLFFLAVGTMIMSSADAFMTLQLLERGATEANPVMAGLISRSTAAFAAVKLLLTAGGIFALVFLARLRFLNRVRNGSLLTILFTMYACLICYEFVYLLQVL